MPSLALFPPLEDELESKLHVARVGLHVRDAAELASELSHDAVERAVGIGRQAPAGIGQSQALMVQRVKELPAELDVFALRDSEVLEQTEISVPERWRPRASQSKARRIQSRK